MESRLFAKGKIGEHPAEKLHHYRSARPLYDQSNISLTGISLHRAPQRSRVDIHRGFNPPPKQSLQREKNSVLSRQLLFFERVGLRDPAIREPLLLQVSDG